jgi:hypothetical protein
MLVVLLCSHACCALMLVVLSCLMCSHACCADACCALTAGSSPSQIHLNEGCCYTSHWLSLCLPLTDSSPAHTSLLQEATSVSTLALSLPHPLSRTHWLTLSYSLAQSFTFAHTHRFSLTVSLTLSLCSLRTFASLMLSAQQVVTSVITPRWRQECRRTGVQFPRQERRGQEAGAQEAGAQVQTGAFQG